MNNTIIMGVIGADVHSVGNRILDFAFTEAGFNVVNLGVMVSKREFIDAAIETAASAIIVSSLYGHGELDCRGLRGMCEEAGIGGILLYAGGNLVVGKTPFEEIRKRFRDMGFDRVYPPGTSPQEGINDLAADLALVGAKARV
jgi:methylaspartate mutase sigma subunit